MVALEAIVLTVSSTSRWLVSSWRTDVSRVLAAVLDLARCGRSVRLGKKPTKLKSRTCHRK
ncbi:hypothetical protein [Streptomyces fractus]|uniref:hypothetical protein n=1 Tax=Streptomyces fractus TaxID=641806 RepID=UPI003CEDD005